MMNIWILTIGSSDVQLKTKKNWTTLSRNVRSQLDDRGFQPSDDQEKRFRVPSRVMGVVYGQTEAEQHFEDLTFPLIDNFISKIKAESISIDRIVFILSDQSIFSKPERSSQSHPYWQDTCELKGLLEKHVKRQLTESSANLHFQEPPLTLKARSTAKGLDDWDEVLLLLQPQIFSLKFPEDSTIYVSHQAGTPAISSAVQFCSLAQFGDRVKFLVSSEYKPELTGFVQSSSYLRGIKLEQAKKLLENYDYAGVDQLIGDYLQAEDKILLDAALQWNYAKFDDFVSELTKLKSHQFQELIQVLNNRCQPENYWWTAYESAYLSEIRLEQKNILEAMFHAFRAVEGLIREWVLQKYPQQIKYSNPAQPNTPYFHDIDLPKQLDSWFNHNKHKKFSTVALHGKALFDLLKESRSSRKIIKDPHISQVLCGDILAERNTIFHQLQGLDSQRLYHIWGDDVATAEQWKMRVLGCIHFIADLDIPQDLKSRKLPKEISLMAQVHRHIAIAVATLSASNPL